MNLLYVLKSFPTSSGVDAVTRTLGNEFVKIGHNVYVCCFLYSRNSSLVDPRIKVYEFPNEWKFANSKGNSVFLNKIIIENSIDIIINQEADVIDICSLCNNARIGTKAKLISCLHFSLFMGLDSKGGFISRFLPKKTVRDRRIRIQLKRRNFAYDNSDVFVMLSNRFVEEYKKYMPNKNLSKLRNIYNAINYETINIDFSKKTKSLLVVSRIEEKQKRISLILEIWKKISKNNNYKDWNLTIVGDGSDMKKIKKLAENLPRINFKGWQDPRNFYLDSSIFLMTSAFEGWGITLVESLQRACVPVAMNSFSSLHDIIANEENGFIIPNNDIEAFVEKVCLLMDNVELREKMAKNGMENCKKFDVKVITNEWEKLFAETL